MLRFLPPLSLPIFSLFLLVSSACLAQFGTVDTDFIPAASNSDVTATAVQADGKVVIAGNFAQVGGNVRNRMARLNSDGTLDPVFNPGLGPSDAPKVLLIQPDGKMLVGGNFGLYNSTVRIRLARINTDGSLDTAFKTGTGANSNVLAMALQPDGKILVGGSFATFNGYSCNGLVRLKTNGRVDSTFNPGAGFNGVVEDLALYPDGRLVAVGGFVSYNGIPRKNIVRILANGLVDPTFDPGTGPDSYVMTCQIQPDGKIFIAGNFTSVSGNSLKRVARFNSDGSVDVGFNPGAGVANGVISSALQPNGKILIVGNFISVDGITCRYIACLNPNGSLDMGFNPGGYGSWATVVSINLQADGKILIGGIFLQYNGSSRSHVARLKVDETTAISNLVPANQPVVFPNPVRHSGTVHCTGIQGKGTVRVFDRTGKKVAEHSVNETEKEFSTTGLKPGLYLLHFSTTQLNRVVRLVVD